MASAPPVTLATNPSAGEYVGAATSGTGRIANAGAVANAQGATTHLGGIGSTLQTQGALALDPVKEKDFKNLSNDILRITRPWTRAVTKAEGLITTAQADRTRLQAKIDAGTPLTTKEQDTFDKAQETITKNQAIVDEFRPKIDAQGERMGKWMTENVADAPKFTELLNESFPELAQQLTNSQPFLDQMGKLGPQGEALMGALQAGFQGSNITFNNAEALGSSAAQLGAAPTATAAQAGFVQGPQAAQASLSGTPIPDVTTSAIQAGQVGPQQQIQAQQIQAAQMGNIAPVKGPAGYTPQQVRAIQAQRVADISSQQIQSGALGNQLMSEAQRRVSLNGQLSPEATRDAIQSARQGFAARGLATGNAALGAELLNRDRYSRQRAMEDLQFAQGVQGADITRQQANQDAALRAAAANQSTAAGFSIADQSAGMSAQQLNQSAGARAAEFTQSGQLQAGLANAQTDYNIGQTNAQLRQQGVLSNQDADLRAQAANQGTTLSAGTVQAQLGTQESIAQAGHNLAVGQSNQATALNVFGQGNNMNQFNAGNQQAANLAAYQGAINQGQFNAGQTNQVGLANLGLAGQYGLQQGQMTQQNNQFNAAQGTQNNQFNATGQFNASGAQADNNRLNFGTNINALQGAYGLNQNVIQGGLGAAAMTAAMSGAANPNAMMLNMYNSAQPVGSQAMGPATSLAAQWGTNQMTTSGFNANAQNWASGQQWAMNNMPSNNPYMTGSALGDFALNTGVNIGTKVLFG